MMIQLLLLSFLLLMEGFWFSTGNIVTLELRRFHNSSSSGLLMVNVIRDINFNWSFVSTFLVMVMAVMVSSWR